MKRKYCNYYPVLLVSLVFLIIYCSGSGISDTGGGLDIGNPVKVCVVDSLDRPVASASVRILRSGSWLSDVFSGRTVVAKSAECGKDGIALIDSLPADECNLQVDHLSGGAFIRNIIFSDSQKVNVVRLQKYGTVSGKISSTSGAPSEIYIEGSAYSSSIDSDGSYRIKTVINNAYTALVRSEDSQWNFAEKINVSSMDTTVNISNVSFNALLIDDFEDSLKTHKIGKYLRGSGIYTEEKIGSVDFSTVESDVDSGRVLKATFVTNKAYTLMGFYIGKKPSGDSLWDFSSASGLSFFAKGSGKLNISVESDTIDKMGTYKQYSSDIVLHEQWQKYSVSFDSLGFNKDLNPNPSITWKESSKSIKRIEFNAIEGDTIKLWIDDIMVNGADLSEIY